METVRDVMTTNVDFCTSEDNVYEAAIKMRDLNVGSIPVVDNSKIVGIVTDRDLVVRGIAEKHPGSNQITSVMSSDIISVTPDTTLQEAANMMADNEIRRLPVVENDCFVGIVALGDLATNEMSDTIAGEALRHISE